MLNHISKNPDKVQEWKHRISIANSNQSEETKRKRYETRKRNGWVKDPLKHSKNQSEKLKRLYAEGKIINPRKGKKASPETIEKMKIVFNTPEMKELSRKNGLANKGRFPTEETKNKMREVWKNPDYKKRVLNNQKQNIKINSKEKIVFDIINKFSNEFEYTGNGKYWITGKINNITKSFNPDFINKKDKRIIEFYGDYFHNQEKNKENDKLREELYNHRNYPFLIIWQSELKDQVAVENKILNFVKSQSLT